MDTINSKSIGKQIKTHWRYHLQISFSWFKSVILKVGDNAPFHEGTRRIQGRSRRPQNQGNFFSFFFFMLNLGIRPLFQNIKIFGHETISNCNFTLWNKVKMFFAFSMSYLVVLNYLTRGSETSSWCLTAWYQEADILKSSIWIVLKLRRQRVYNWGVTYPFILLNKLVYLLEFYLKCIGCL